METPLLTAANLDWESRRRELSQQERFERIAAVIAAIVILACILIVGHLEYLDQVALERYEAEQAEAAR